MHTWPNTRFVPSINLHQLQLSLLTSIDLEYESYTHSLQMNALIMNSLTYRFGLSIHLNIVHVWIFIINNKHLRLRSRQNTAYLQLMSKRCTSSNSIISVTLMDSFNIFYGIYKLSSTALQKLWDNKEIKNLTRYAIFNSSKLK